MKKQKLKKNWYFILIGKICQCIAMVTVSTAVVASLFIAMFLLVPEQEQSEEWHACRNNVIEAQRNAERYNMN